MSNLTGNSLIFACTLVAVLLGYCEARAERSIVEVTPGEYRRLGYQDKSEFMELYSQCQQVANGLKKNQVCADDECVKKSQEWRANNCEKHSTTFYYLTSFDPPRYPVSEMFDNSARASYVRLYIGSCQDGYRAMNPGGDATLVKSTCECAANQSLDLIEYNDYKAFESPNASKEVIARVKNRAAYSRFICENKPAVWREQSGDIGTSAGIKTKIEGAGGGARADLADGKLVAMFDQLKGQGSALYGSLLAKLKAEARDKSCESHGSCNKINESFGTIYKDVLYVVYAIEIYKATDESSRFAARGKLNDFVKVALLSMDPNINFIRSYVTESQAAKAKNPLLTKAFRDAEECQKLLATVSRELEKR